MLNEHRLATLEAKLSEAYGILNEFGYDFSDDNADSASARRFKRSVLPPKVDAAAIKLEEAKETASALKRSKRSALSTMSTKRAEMLNSLESQIREAFSILNSLGVNGSDFNGGNAEPQGGTTGMKKRSNGYSYRPADLLFGYRNFKVLLA